MALRHPALPSPALASHGLRGRRLRAALAGSAVVAATMLGSLPGTATATPATAAPAAATTHRTHHETARERQQRFTAKADRVLRVARSRKGSPYQYGAAGPHRFDCSGLVMWVFNRALGRSLPHNAAEQYYRSKHISRRELRPGDLVFVSYGGSISHVGIFAGHGYWWVAPHTGTRVHKQKIYSAHLLYGRIIHA
ncbi:MAG: C40 family peptidase [Frankiales bacterium]|nr:C40 family peptidase [Frankiales bacterium]